MTVEFFGIARHRAGVTAIEVDASSLGDALDRAAERLPRWAEACLEDGRLRPAFLANLNARSFISGRQTPLSDGDHLLILAADVGG